MKERVFIILVCLTTVLILIYKLASEEKFERRIVDNYYLVKIDSDIELGLKDVANEGNGYAILVKGNIIELGFNNRYIIVKQEDPDNGTIRF